MKAVILLCLLHSAFGQENKYSWDGLTGVKENTDPGQNCVKDQGSCGCCTIYQEVDQMKEYFKERLSQLEAEYMKVQQNFGNLNASHIAFSVSLLKGGPLKCFGNVRDSERLVYKHVQLNLGEAYDVENGVFTAPHSGIYSLAITVNSDTGSPQNKMATCASLQVNNQDIVGATDKNTYDHEDSSSNVVALELKAGDEVHVNVPSGCFICDNQYHYNTFSGFLLYLTE